MKNFEGKLKKYFYDGFKNTYAEWAIVLWMIIPLFMGIINYTMLKRPYYDAYVYYDCWKIVVSLVLSCALFLTVLFVMSICLLNKDGIKGIFARIYTSERWMLFWLALAIWTLVSVACSVDVSGAFWGVSYMAEGYMGHLFGIVLVICASFIKKKERVQVLSLFCIITDILSCVMLGYEFNVPFLRAFSAASGQSFYTNSNHFGYILAMAILCMAGMYFMYLQEDSEKDAQKRKRRCFFYGLSFVFNAFALMYNNTLGVYWAVVIGLVVIMIFWKIRIGKLSLAYYMPILCILIFTAMSFFGLFINQLGSSVAKSLIGMWKDIFKVKKHSEGYQKAGTNRIGLWMDAVRAIVKRPIVGYGPGIRYDSDWNEIIRTLPHNEYIECALFMGIPGLIMYLGGLITLCVDRCKKLKTINYTDIVAAGALIGYLVSAVVGARRFHTFPYMFVFIGLLVTWESSSSNKDDEQEETVTVEKTATIEEPAIVEESMAVEEPAVVEKSAVVEETETNQKEVEEINTIEKSVPNNESKKETSIKVKENRLFAKLETVGISKVCATILLAWTIIPILVAIGFIPISRMHAGEGILILTYYQVSYNTILVYTVGIIGFILFMIMLSGKRDKLSMTTKQILIEKTKNEVWIVLLALLLLWSFISAALSDTVVTAFVGTAIKRDGFFAYCIYAAVFGIAYFIEDEKLIKKILIWYSCVTNIMGLVMMFYEWGIPVLSDMSHAYSCATFMNPNHFGYFLGMSIMCLVGLFYMDLYRVKENGENALSKYGIYYIVSFGWQMYVLMINNSLGAFVAVVIATTFAMIFWKIRFGKLGVLAWLPAVIALVITLISYMGWIDNLWGETVGESLNQFFLDIFKVAKHSEGFEKAGTNRMGLWIEAIKLIPTKPIFGYGPEGLTGHFKEINAYDRPHNEYLQLAVFCGVPALLMYLSALITLCVNRCKKLKTISPVTIAVAGVVIGYLVNAFFGFTLYYTTPYFFMFLGFVAGSVREKNR